MLREVVPWVEEKAAGEEGASEVSLEDATEVVKEKGEKGKVHALTTRSVAFESLLLLLSILTRRCFASGRWSRWFGTRLSTRSSRSENRWRLWETLRPVLLRASLARISSRTLLLTWPFLRSTWDLQRICNELFTGKLVHFTRPIPNCQELSNFPGHGHFQALFEMGTEEDAALLRDEEERKKEGPLPNGEEVLVEDRRKKGEKGWRYGPVSVVDVDERPEPTGADSTLSFR